MSPLLASVRSIGGRLVLIALMTWVSNTIAFGCGGCYQLPYQSLLEKVEKADRAIVARPSDARGLVWKIDRTIKGRSSTAQVSIQVDKGLGGQAYKTNGQYILTWNQILDLWTVEASANQELVEFLGNAFTLLQLQRRPLSVRYQAQNVRFFLPYLEHSDPQVADSAHAKLVAAPYLVLQQLADELDPDQLLERIELQSSTKIKRVALSIMLLGICGGQREAKLVSDWLQQSSSGGNVAYLGSLLTAHIQLAGEAGVRFIESEYIQNSDRTLGELIAAVDALRTHGQAGKTIARPRVQATFHRLLNQRPALAELVIEDLARWEDWSAVPTLLEIYRSGRQPWNNAVILSYLESCPLQEVQSEVDALLGNGAVSPTNVP